MDATVFESAFSAVAPYFTDPTFLMTLVIAGSMLLAILGKLSWRLTGIILLLGAIYSKLAETFGPEAAVTIIVSNVVTYLVSQLLASFKQKVIYQPIDQALKEKD